MLNIQYQLDAKEFRCVVTCGMDDCGNSMTHVVKETDKVYLPHASNMTINRAKAEGWGIGKAYPRKVMSVKSRDELGNPTETHQITSTTTGDLCPSCYKKVHPPKE